MIRIKDTSNFVSKGNKFGKWKVIGKPFSNGVKSKNNRGKYLVVCRCSCGYISVLQCSVLHLGYSKSCKSCCPKAIKHGDGSIHKRVRLYKNWQEMWQRCTNPSNKKYKDYGARGITVYPNWRDYTVFKKWALANGYKKHLFIDRKNNNGNYTPKNCRWVTVTENNRNKRNNRILTCFGETKCVAAWVDDPRCVVSSSTLINRLNRNWSTKRAITTKTMNKYSHSKGK